MRRADLAMACWFCWSGCGGDAGINLNRRSAAGSPGVMAGPDAGVAAGAAPSMPDFIQDLVEPPPFEDLGCPPVTTPPASDACNPLAEPSGCGTGESCFPYVDYPSGPCEVERFGTVCRRAGSGTQGASCAREACAADYICVSTGRGTQCARLCGLGADAPNVCSPGLLCLPIDIDGFGGCL